MTPGPDTDQQRLEAWEKRTLPLLVAAAIIPLTSLGEASWWGILLDFAAWGVFLADLIMHGRFSPGYLRRGVGIFDTVVVVLTFPWYIIPGLGTAQFLGVLRLARLARVVILFKGARRFIRRLGPAAVYAGALVFVAALIVLRNEPPERGYETIWDGVWWGFVTVTTVGYGDLTPVTTAGRVAGLLLMVSGIGLLGILAGALASLFGFQETAEEARTDPVAEELARLREQVEALSSRLDLQRPDA